MPRLGEPDVASMDCRVKGADWPSSQPVAHLGRTPLGVWVGTAFTRHLGAEEEDICPCAGRPGSGGGRQGLGSDESFISQGLGRLTSSGLGYFQENLTNFTAGTPRLASPHRALGLGRGRDS